MRPTPQIISSPVVGHQLPEQALVAQAREHLVGVVALAVVAGQMPRSSWVAKAGSMLPAAAVEVGAAARQAGDLAAQAVDQDLVVGHAAVGAAAHVHVHLGAADVEAGHLLRLGALDERGAGDDHVRLLGHVHAVGDDRHVAAAGDAVAEHAGELRHAVGRQQAVHLEDVAGAGAPGEALRLLGEEQARAVDEVDRRQAQAQRHGLGALDLLRRARPPRPRGDGVVVGDDHAPAPSTRRERGDHAGARRAQAVAEDLAVVDEGADLACAVPGSIRRARRSRAVSLPLAWTRSTYLGPQPATTSARRARRRSSSGASAAR
jgi:hypothetical protein